MTWQQVIAGSPYLALFAFCVFISALFRCVFLCWNRFLRWASIRKSGWPPAHCDADGDFPPRRDGDQRADE